TAFRVAIAGFIIPFVFVLQPALLLQEGGVADVVVVVVMAMLGMVGLASGLSGYLVTEARVLERILLVVAGIALIYPSVPVSVPGLILLALIAVVQGVRRQGQRSSGSTELPHEQTT